MVMKNDSIFIMLSSFCTAPHPPFFHPLNPFMSFIQKEGLLVVMRWLNSDVLIFKGTSSHAGNKNNDVGLEREKERRKEVSHTSTNSQIRSNVFFALEVIRVLYFSYFSFFPRLPVNIFTTLFRFPFYYRELKWRYMTAVDGGMKQNKFIWLQKKFNAWI